MLILALDTSAVVCSVALTEEDRVLCVKTVSQGQTHSETLLPMIEALYLETGRSVAETDLLAVSAGPGSFTGVRIGVATVKGLAYDGACCIGVSTLEALAYNFLDRSGIVCPVMDARRGQLYNALFRVENGQVLRLCPDRAVTVNTLVGELVQSGSPVFLCGDGYEIARPVMPTELLLPTSPKAIYQNASSVARLAYRIYMEGNYTDDRQLRPSYLRMPQAERERQERLRAEISDKNK